MIRPVVSAGIYLGAALTAIYTLLISGADAITKDFAQSFAAPQLFIISGGLVALFSFLATKTTTHNPDAMKVRCRLAMVIRVIATVLGTIAFYYAFRFLPFADVFLFIALVPLITAVLSGVALGETVDRQSWFTLILGAVGVGLLFPEGLHQINYGHATALVAVIFGAVSMVASRYMSQRGERLLTQVFYPNLAMMFVMMLALPFVFRPMGLADIGLAFAYAFLLFLARLVLVASLRLLPAYVVTPLINLQFVWMVLIGLVFFGEYPALNTYLGAFIVVLAGVWLVFMRLRLKSEDIVPAE